MQLRGARSMLATAAACLVVGLAAGCSLQPVTVPVPIPVPSAWASPKVTYERWHPDTPIQLPQDETDAVLAKERTTYLKRLARQLSIADPPNEPLRRWTTYDDYSVTLATCLSEHGYNTVPSATGGVLFPDGVTGEEAETAYNRAEFVCQSRYTLKPKYRRDWTPEQQGLVYDYYVAYLIPCLERNGAAIPEPPTRDDFVRDFFTSKPDAKWDPYGFLSLPAEELQAPLLAECPHQPDSRGLSDERCKWRWHLSGPELLACGRRR